VNTLAAPRRFQPIAIWRCQQYNFLDDYPGSGLALLVCFNVPSINSASDKPAMCSLSNIHKRAEANTTVSALLG
jgi:hypothetical protein